MLADGAVRRFVGGEELRAFRCHLGQLGIVTKVKFQMTPAFWLECRHERLPDETGFAQIFEQAKVDTSGLPDFLWMEPAQVVRESLAALERDEVVCVPGLANRTMSALTRLLPHAASSRITAAISSQFLDEKR